MSFIHGKRWEYSRPPSAFEAFRILRDDDARMIASALNDDAVALLESPQQVESLLIALHPA